MSFDIGRSLRNLSEAAYPATERRSVDPVTGFALLGVLLPLEAILAGAFRATLRIRLPWALAFASVPWLFLLSLVIHRFRPSARDWRRAAAVMFSIAVPMVIAIGSLDNGAFAGLPSTGGGDAGNHVLLQQRFLRDDPTSYLGFVSFYAATYIAEAFFGANTFEAFRAAFYVVPVVVVLAGMLAVVLAHSEVREKSVASLPLVASPILALVLWEVLLPLFHRYQGDGFYPQVFGFVTLCLAWLFWGLVDHPVLRGVLLVFGLILYRYSYGLNLADLAFSGAFLLVLDRRQLARTRLAAVALGALLVALVGIGVSTLISLYPHHADSGGIVPAHMQFLMPGAALGALVLLATSRAPKLADHFRARARRFMDFSGAFALMSVGIEALYLVTGHPPSYYFFKHGFHPAALVSLGLFFAAVVLIGECLVVAREAAWRSTMRMLLPLAACVIALALLVNAMNTYRESFRERAGGAPPWKSLMTLWDLDAAGTIEQVLREEKKDFGGYLTPVWAEANFTNAVFGRWRGFGVYGPDAVTEQAGHCAFWQATDQDLRSLENAELGGKGALIPVVRKLEDGTDKHCSNYTPRWDPAQRRSLCYRCF